MPTLRSFFAIYTHGAGLHEPVRAGDSITTTVVELTPPLTAAPSDELYGPHAAPFRAFTPRRAFLIGFSKPLKGRAESFFLEVRDAVLRATEGLEGFGLDVLKLWPFPLAGAAEALPEDLLAEDLFSFGITERGAHGFQLETFGLAKLDQREISFEFSGHELVEEATLLCGHLADWLLEHTRRVEPGQAMSFGFDKLTFEAAEGRSGRALRAYHPALIQRLLPEAAFPGLGLLRVSAPPTLPKDHAVAGDLSTVLRRSMEQRLLLEEQDLTGDSPHSETTAEVRGAWSELRNLVASRDESISGKDSGWRIRSGSLAEPHATKPLAEIAAKLPELVRYLALPVGIRLAWDAEGRLTIDRSKVELDDDDFEDSLPDE